MLHGTSGVRKAIEAMLRRASSACEIEIVIAEWKTPGRKLTPSRLAVKAMASANQRLDSRERDRPGSRGRQCNARVHPGFPALKSAHKE